MPNKAVTNLIKKVPVQTPQMGLITKLIHHFISIKTQSIVKRISKYFKGTRFLDVGTGTGGIATKLIKSGYKVKSLDVDNTSLFLEVPTELYDGTHMPYKDKEFDTALIIHVLHHCKERESVLREAMRVSKRVIFIEDTYRNSLEKLIVSLNDMVANGEYYFHRYYTKTQWNEVIKSSGWKILGMEEYSEFSYGFMYSRYLMYVIE